jgi:ribosomal protein S4
MLCDRGDHESEATTPHLSHASQISRTESACTLLVSSIPDDSHTDRICAQKARQDWSKYNLYNIQRLRTPQAKDKTFFQQKWAAKALARGYHNPYVREGQWTRMFDRRLPAVVPMDFKYLARNDGSEQATGRGLGLQEPEEEQVHTKGPQQGKAFEGRRKRVTTPYMHMAFHPLERRLDTAIFRALFASSSKQARQFVVHGSVKVNGKKVGFRSIIAVRGLG